MSVLKSSNIFYLDLNSMSKENQDVKIKSNSGGEVNLNRLFLVPFSPILTSVFSKIVSESETTSFTIITEYDQSELEILSKFCTKGLLPMPVSDFVKDVPSEVINLFNAFGIDLAQILFKKDGQNDSLKKEPIAGMSKKSLNVYLTEVIRIRAKKG